MENPFWFGFVNSVSSSQGSHHVSWDVLQASRDAGGGWSRVLKKLYVTMKSM